MFLKKYKIIKPLFILFLFCLFSTFYTISASALTNEKGEEINIYITNKEEAQVLIDNTVGKLSDKDYHGWCGAYSRDVMIQTGILKSNTAGYDGKDWYPAFKNQSSSNRLADDWTYDCYDGKDALRQILEKYNGKVYNLLFSMSNTGPYGHVFFVNAIIDDTVYFTESFATGYFDTDQKELIVTSLGKFVDYYINSSYFNMNNGGIVHFYEKDFYKPVAVFNENNTVSSSYVYKYSQEKMNSYMYDDLEHAGIQLQENKTDTPQKTRKRGFYANFKSIYLPDSIIPKKTASHWF